ncbi:hypothetical protein BDK51DRAFT_14990, partial [Blyttiomyces helicus]
RTKTSLIPPKIASLKELGKLQSTSRLAHPDLFAKLKYYYVHIPKGDVSEGAVQAADNSFYGRYKKKYMGNESLWPIAHFIAVMIPISYYISYFKGG